MFCIYCSGSGQLLGNGMLSEECHVCSGIGRVNKKNDYIKKTPKEIDRRSKHYKDAIKQIMSLNKDISYEDAVKMFEKAYHKD